MNEEFIKKMRQADRLRLEAVRSLLPEDMRDHVDVISQELKAMAKDLVKDIAKEGIKIYTESATESEEKTEKKVNKIKIQ